jgi:16S rRNA (adenine1518-N6/adenine1519-N6)-dimethyltransferase
MFQKEVALRIASSHGSKQYGILSVLLQTWYDVKVLFSVSEQAFIPPPKVQSAVILVQQKAALPDIANPKLFREMVKVIFNQRRKMLKTPLRHRFGQHLTIPYENLRPEQLSVSDFMVLYQELERQGCC